MKQASLSNSRPPDCYEVRIDLSSVLDYLKSVLDPSLVEEEAPAAILSLLVASTVDLTTSWQDKNQLEEAISYLVNSYGYEPSFAMEVCRTADNMISSRILSFDPEFGSDHYYGQISHNVFFDNVLSIYIRKETYEKSNAKNPHH